MPQSAETSDFAADTQRLPGPTILSTRGIVRVPYAMAAIACAPPILKRRSAPASMAAANTAASGRGQHDDDFRDAGDTRRNCRHQKGRGQGIAAGRHVAADARERRDPLFDRDAWGDVVPPAFRHLPFRHRADVACCPGDRDAHLSRQRVGPQLPNRAEALRSIR